MDEDWAQHADARSHRADDVVAGMGGRIVLDADVQCLPVDFDAAAELPEEAAHIANVTEVGHAPQDDLVAAKQCRGHQGQRRVLRSVDRDAARESLSTLNPESIHAFASGSFLGLRSRRDESYHGRGEIVQGNPGR